MRLRTAPLLLLLVAAGTAAGDECNNGVVLTTDDWSRGYGKCCDRADGGNCVTAPCVAILDAPLCLGMMGKVGMGPCEPTWDTGYCGICPDCAKNYPDDAKARQDCDNDNKANNCEPGDVRTCVCPWSECDVGNCTVDSSGNVRCVSSTCKLTHLSVGLIVAAGILFCCAVALIVWCCCKGTIACFRCCCGSRKQEAGYVQHHEAGYAQQRAPPPQPQQHTQLYPNTAVE